jgi:hypothetical protein
MSKRSPDERGEIRGRRLVRSRIALRFIRATVLIPSLRGALATKQSSFSILGRQSWIASLRSQ